jgi:hypothetical protein
MLEKVAKTVAKSKYNNIFIKDQFENPKHVNQTPSKLLKYVGKSSQNSCQIII